MPFTFSHPAIVLPLAHASKKWISLSALIAGSLAPDFEYFLKLGTRSYYSHNWDGIFWFDLPLSIIMLFVFHLIIRNKLIDHLPDFFYRRLWPFQSFDWSGHFKKNFIAVMLSIIIGAASHILWDGFTHRGGLFVENISALEGSFSLAGHSIYVYDFLQHLSTILGGIAILYVIVQLPSADHQPESKPMSSFWFIIGVFTLFTTAGRWMAGINREFYATLIIASISGFMLGLIIACIFGTRKRNTY